MSIATDKPTKMTKKMRAFAKEYATNGEIGSAAAKKVYNVKNDNSARSIASEVLTSPSVQAEIEKHRNSLQEALVEKGITPAKIADKVSELLEHENYKAINNGLTHATKIYGVEEKPQANNYTQINIFSKEMKQATENFEQQIKKQLGYAEDTE